MKMHNYLFDINYLISCANVQANGQIEDFALQLDYFLSNQDKLTLETEELVNMTINLLKGILQDESINQECDCARFN